MIGAPDHDNRRPAERAVDYRPVRGAEQLTGMGPGGVAVRVPREHPGQFGDPVLVLRPRLPWSRCGPGTAPLTTLICASAWEATWARWVTTSTWRSPPDLVQRLAQGQCGRPAHPGVHLVEDHRLGAAEADQADGQHGPGQLAARGGAGQGLHRLADVGAQGELDGLPRPLGAPPGPPGGRPAMASAPRRSPTRSAKEPAARARTARTAASASASSAQRRSRSACSRAASPSASSSATSRAAPSRAEGHDGGQVLAVLAPQLGQQTAALLHVDEALRIVLPPFDLVAQRAGQVGQLDGGGGQAGVVALEGLAAGQRGAGAAEEVEGSALAGGIEQVQRLESGVAVGGGVGQAVLLQAQGRPLRRGPPDGRWRSPPPGSAGRPPRGRAAGRRRRAPASASSIAWIWLRIARTRLRSVPAKASRTLRCAVGVTRARCSCCPWISTSSAAASPSAASGAMRPSTQARDRPSAGTDRVRITSRSSLPSPTTKRASTRASVAPARTMPVLARPPSTSWSASTTRVLPAPVSPVSAVMPGPKSRVRSSITPRSRTCRSVSTDGLTGPGRPAAGNAGCRRRSGARCARRVPGARPPCR